MEGHQLRSVEIGTHAPEQEARRLKLKLFAR
jgi:hypothetical protein